MRRLFEVGPRAGGTARGAERNGLGLTGANVGTLATGACHCGPGRVAGPDYVCVTCAKFALIGRRIEQRAPHLLTERRRAA